MKTLRILTLFTIVLAAISFTSCSSDNDEIEKKEEVIETLETQILGAWCNFDSFTFVFENNGKCWFNIEEGEEGQSIEKGVQGTYKIDGNKVTMSYNSQPVHVFTVNSINDSEMIVQDNQGRTSNFVKIVD